MFLGGLYRFAAFWRFNGQSKWCKNVKIVLGRNSTANSQIYFRKFSSFLDNLSISPLHVDSWMFELQVKDVNYSTVTLPHMVQFTSSTDSNVPILGQLCFLCLIYTADFFKMWLLAHNAMVILQDRPMKSVFGCASKNCFYVPVCLFYGKGFSWFIFWINKNYLKFNRTTHVIFCCTTCCKLHFYWRMQL